MHVTYIWTLIYVFHYHRFDIIGATVLTVYAVRIEGVGVG